MLPDRRNNPGGTLQERIRARLQTRMGDPTKGPRTSALLLDVSGSMRERIGANVRKVDELRKLVQEFPGVRRFDFASTAREVRENEDLREPNGGTAMDIAFFCVKRAGIEHIVLITDGKPDSAERALSAATDLKIDVLYVGPDPAPEFLERLCRHTGGTYGKATLEARKELTERVRGLLPAGKGPVCL